MLKSNLELSSNIMKLKKRYSKQHSILSANIEKYSENIENNLKMFWTAFTMTSQMTTHTLLSYKLIEIYSENIEQYSVNIKNILKILKNISSSIHDDLADDDAHAVQATN